jgi:hypothetical protein
MLASVFPTGLPAVASAPSPQYLLSALKIDGEPLMTMQGRVQSMSSSDIIDPYATYVYNIASADSTSVTLEWEGPAGSTAELLVDNVFLLGQNALTSSVVIETSRFTASSQIRLTVTSENLANSISYVINVAKRVPSDNYRFWPQNYHFVIESGTFSPTVISGGQIPDPVDFNHLYWQVPGAGTMFKSGYAFKGWRDDDDPSKVYIPDEFILLDRNISATPVWILDEPGLAISVEGSAAIYIDNYSEATHYVAFDIDAPDKISFSINSDSRFQLALWSYTASTASQVIYDAVDSDTSERRFLKTNCNVDTDPGCPNLFRLEVIAHSPSGQQLPKTVNIMLLRRYAPNALPSFRFEWSDDASSDSPVLQGWYQLPSSAPDEHYPGPTHILVGFTQTVGGVTTSYSVSQYVPIFTDQTFKPVFAEVDISPTVNLFGYQLTFDWCQNLVLEYCLSYRGQVYEPENNAFYITVPLSEPILDLDSSSQSFEVHWSTWPDDGEPLGGTSNLYSLDFRRPWWWAYNDEVQPNSDNELSDEQLCPDGECHEAWGLELLNEELDGIVFYYDVRFILDDDPTEQFTVDIANDITSSAFASTTATKSWISLPTFSGHVKEDHEATEWTSEESWDNLEDFTLSNSEFQQNPIKYPILGNDVIFPNWQELIQVRFLNGNTELLVDEFTGYYELQAFEPELPDSPNEFLGWALTQSGVILAPDFVIDQDSDLYAIWAAPPPSQNQVQNNTPTPPQPPVIPVLPPTIEDTTTKSEPASVSFKTTVSLKRTNGVTQVIATVPKKYVNQPARIEIRRLIAGKVRYFTLSKGWTHFNSGASGTSNAHLVFKFKLALGSKDLLRVKVGNIQVIRMTGAGKPAWD